MNFDMNRYDGPIGIYSLGASLGCYMAFLYYSLMESTLEHTIAALAVAIFGGIFLIVGAVMLALNSSNYKKANFQRETGDTADTIVTLLIVVTVFVIAGLVVLSQVIKSFI